MAQEINILLDIDYLKAENLVPVWDNLNPHTPTSFQEKLR